MCLFLIKSKEIKENSEQSTFLSPIQEILSSTAGWSQEIMDIIVK